MTGPDPLEGLPFPPGDPEVLAAQAGRIGEWAAAVSDCGDRLHQVLSGVTARSWRGVGASAARDGSARVAGAYGRAAQDLVAARQVLSRCVGDWTEARACYTMARHLADEAVLEERACAAAATPPEPALRSQAQALARTAITDYEAASKQAASALVRLAEQVDSGPAFMSVAGAPWYSWPVRWGRDALQFAGRGERDSLDAGRYVISNPSEFGRLLDDAIQVAGGAALAEAGAGGFGAGVGLDLTGFGLPAGIALGAASALGLVTGAALAAHGFADGIGDLANVYSMSIDGGKPSEIPSDPPDGWLEGRSNIVVRAPGSNVDITDVDRVSGGVLWELKSAAAAPDSSIWIKEQMFDKFDRFIEARRLLPGYQDAPIGFDFTGSDIYPPFRQAVESAVKALRSGFPDVTVYLRWAG